MNKEELRKTYLAKRFALTDQEYQELSNKISEQFFGSVDLKTVKVVHIFIPIQSKREPDTWIIINRFRQQFKQIRLAIPKVNGEHMDSIFFESNNQLGATKWGMTEPVKGERVQPREIDLVVVPLLAVDNQGHRIGYGKGFYDRFLKECRPDCLKVGLSFFSPEEVINERLEADVLLDRCITPNEMISF